MQANLNEKFFSSVLKGALTSLIVALVGVFILAFIVKLSCLSANIVQIVVLFLKIICVFVGCYLTFKGGKGFFKGAVSGILFAVISHLIFSCVSGEQIVNKGLFVDILVCFSVGAISGIIAVNTNK